MNHQIRNDVQGLRAVAVLLVYASHSGMSFLSGGFVGVDVFFVISGYVITLSLLNEYEATRNVNLTRFYARRLIRLVPALFFVLLLCTILSLILLSPYEQLYNYESLKAALIWLSNFYFLNLEGGYFDISASEYLYIHTWSLAVEEQFYLIWPLVIMFGLGCFSKNKDIKVINRVVTFIAAVGVSSFLLLALLVAVEDNNRAFYMMPARAWQFALGAYFAFSHVKMRSNQYKPNHFFGSNAFVSTISFIGLALIIISAYLFTNGVAYPSWRVIVPTIGAALLIAPFYTQERLNIVAKILSSKFLVWIGALSYSIYLWHWPVLYFQSRLDQSISVTESLMALALTILLASVTYYCIENPLRKLLNNLTRLKVFVLFGVLTVIMFAIVLASESYTTKHLSDPDQQSIMANRSNIAASTIYQSGCDTWYSSSALKPCVIAPADQKVDHKVYLIGDSIAAQWFERIGQYYVNNNWQVTVLTKSSCPMVDQPFFYKRIGSYYKVCDEWRQSVKKLVAENKPTLIIYGGSSAYPFTKEQWLSGSSSVANVLSNSAEKVILLGGSGGLGFDGPLCLSRHSWRSKFFPQSSSNKCSRKWQEPESLEWLRQVAGNYNNVKYVDFNDYICPGKCFAEVNSIVAFRDSQHLTRDYVNQLSPKILMRLEGLLQAFEE